MNNTVGNSSKNKDIYEYRPLQMKNSQKLAIDTGKKSILKNKNGSLRMRDKELKDSGRGLSSERQNTKDYKEKKQQAEIKVHDDLKMT